METLRVDGQFNAITMLAVIEHLDDAAQRRAGQLFTMPRPGGRVVFTVPEPAVDPINRLLVRLGIFGGIRAERLQLECRERFQLGVNDLFVLRRR